MLYCHLPAGLCIDMYSDRMVTQSLQFDNAELKSVAANFTRNRREVV
jgi:hypothetical protein